MAKKKEEKKFYGFLDKLFLKAEEEEKKDIEDIKKRLDKIDDKNEKVEYLKRELDKKENAHIKEDIRELLIENLKGKNETRKLHLGYDSFAEGLEPVYFWILDFMRGRGPSGLSYDVDKTKEDFEASVGSAFYGDIGTRASIMQDKAMKMMGTINTVIRSVINLIYDLKEFENRLALYDNLKSEEKEERIASELALRALWMDQVDIKKGRGSINNLAQQLQFVTLRDAFMYAEDLKEVDKLDLNERVKRILKARLQEYLKWRDTSAIEIRKRYNIEKGYLRSQVASLKKYTEWAKPYLIAAEKLKMRDFSSPNIVAIFNNMEVELELLGKKKVNVASLIEAGELPSNFKTKKDFFSCLEVTFKFRSVPHTVRRTEAGMQYTMGGKVDMLIKAYNMDEDELDYLKKQEEYRDFALIDEMTDVGLKELQEDLDRYIKEEPEEEKVEKEKGTNPVTALFTGMRDMLEFLWEPISSVPDFFSQFTRESHANAVIRSFASKGSFEDSFTLYDVYKKAHGMLSW